MKNNDKKSYFKIYERKHLKMHRVRKYLLNMFYVLPLTFNLLIIDKRPIGWAQIDDIGGNFSSHASIWARVIEQAILKDSVLLWAWRVV